ncbi:MAG: hypothetical protein LBQ19_04100 [Synergistaceae bacterium]|nr:hypothetical protein [Synergistaceae bacterium]
MSAETPGNRGKFVILIGLLFGLGYMTGFFSGFGYGKFKAPAERQVAVATNAPSLPDAAAAFGLPGAEEEHDEDDAVLLDSELVLGEHELGEDENGLFISGMIFNRSPHGYDAVRVAFDLCDSNGGAYSGITDVTYERMEPGDSWGFTIYIPYSDMSLFSSYKLHSIMGTSK